MDRRTVLATAALSLPILSVSGCTAAPTNNSSASTADVESDTGSRTDSNETTDDETVTNTEPIELEVYNDTSSEVIATVTLTRGNSTVLEDEFEVSPDESMSTETGITETGQYELTVAVADGREQTWSFDIETYDLRAGSGMSVFIEPDELEWLIEE